MIDRLHPTGHEKAYPIGEQTLGSIPVNELGFDVIAFGTFLAPSPPIANQVPPAMLVYVTPDSVQKIEIRRFALVGHPRGTFLNNITWSLRINRSVGQEYQQESRAGEVTPRPPEDAGLRWGPMGSLADPMPVTILMGQKERLEVMFTHVLQQVAGTPFTIYTRAVGVVYS